MSTATAEKTSLDITHRSGFTWNVATQMSREDAYTLLIFRMTDHLTPVGVRRAALVFYATAAIVASIVDRHPAWLITIPCVGVIHAAWRMYSTQKWLKSTLSKVVLTDEELRAVTTVAALSPSSAMNKDAFVGLLTSPPAEVSCAAFGKHINNFCPHRQR